MLNLCVMKRFLLIVSLLALLAPGCKNTAKKGSAEAVEDSVALARIDSINAEKEKNIMVTLAELPAEPVFEIETNLGTIKVKLYSKTPKHRENFAKLALSGYYDGLLFHRVIDGFMIQGGDPNTRDNSPEAVAKYGQGGPDYTVPAEFVPEYRHKKGALAAARRSDAANPKRESSGSQFYIVQDERACRQLDGAYTVFGETVEGFDVIDAIAGVKTNTRDLPLNDVRIIKISLKK